MTTPAPAAPTSPPLPPAARALCADLHHVCALAQLRANRLATLTAARRRGAK